MNGRDDGARTHGLCFFPRELPGTPEEGLVLPFRNGQIEIETAQLNLNVKPEWQFQTRAIVNWCKIFLRSRK